MYLIAATIWSDLWWWISVVLKVAFGLGFVVFVHELGHYLVARLCGVKIEKFMVGFDIGGYKLSWRRGETIYGIGIMPLGGYVKFLGQDDDPAHIAEQMQKSQVDPQSVNAKPIKGPDGETYYVDRRSYLAKSVPQRMAIISAGVVMNIIFAFIFAVIAYGMGVPYLPAIVSEVVPGSPAYQAGIEPGAEFERIGSRKNPTFVQLKSGVTLGDLENGIECQLRDVDGKVQKVTLKPQQSGGRLATIGIGLPYSLMLFGDPPVIDDSPAAHATLVKPAADPALKDAAKFKEGDVVVRVGDAKVENFREFMEQLARQPEKTLQVTVRRPPEDEVEKGAFSEKQAAAENPPPGTELTFDVPTQQLHRFNFAMKMGPITVVREGSPAATAKLEAGDLIERIDGKRLGEGPTPLESWDAETLPDYLRRAAAAGRDVEIAVQRPKANGPADQATIQVKPQLPKLMNLGTLRSPGTPMAANEIGIAYRIENEIALVTPNSPAAVANIAAGDRVVRAKVVKPEDKDGHTPEPVVVDLITEKPGWLAKLIERIFGGASVEHELYDWPRLIDSVQFVPSGTEVELTVQRGEAEPRTVKLAPVAVEGAFVPARGFWFKPVERIRKAETFAEQVRFGWDETTDGLTMVFRFLGKLGTQVPISALGGPVTIAKAAGYSAAEGVSSLLMFLTMLSANLAVLNFLPIPLLDGGHLVFLAYEGIRGRPANEKFVVALHTIGFVFIVSLMLYVLALDLHLIPRNL